MEDFIVFVVIQGIIFGAFCSYVAVDKNRDGGIWFFMGFFFSLLALLALVALSKLDEPDTPATEKATVKTASDEPDTPATEKATVKTASDEPPCERDLSLDRYKLWLVSWYSIERNDVLDSFVCAEKLFPTIEAALEHADFLELEKLEKYRRQREIEEAAEKKNLQLKAERQAELQAQRLEREKKRIEEEKKQKRRQPWWIAAIVASVAAGFYGYQMEQRRVEEQRQLEKQRQLEEKRLVEEVRQAELQQRVEEKRKAEERVQLKQQRLAAEKRRAEEQRQAKAGEMCASLYKLRAQASRIASNSATKKLRFYFGGFDGEHSFSNMIIKIYNGTEYYIKSITGDLTFYSNKAVVNEVFGIQGELSLSDQAQDEYGFKMGYFMRPYEDKKQVMHFLYPAREFTVDKPAERKYVNDQNLPLISVQYSDPRIKLDKNLDFSGTVEFVGKPVRKSLDSNVVYSAERINFADEAIELGVLGKEISDLEGQLRTSRRSGMEVDCLDDSIKVEQCIARGFSIEFCRDRY
jgi:hypothetical protein